MEMNSDRDSRDSGIEMVVFIGTPPLGYVGYGDGSISMAPRCFFTRVEHAKSY